MEIRATWEELWHFTGGKCGTMSEHELDAAWKQLEEELRRRARAMADAERAAAWKLLCPPLYRDTVVERLPCKDSFDEVQNWRYGALGLIVIGPSRRGKTRSVWKLLERVHFEDRKIIAFTPMQLKLKVARVWQDSETAEEWIYRLHRADVLFFDDLDTVKFTEAVEETIYDVFEYRPAHNKPVIVTLNQTGPQLARRMNACGRGAKIVERMREFCHVINFT
jgi:DNA replication protein DnaC